MQRIKVVALVIFFRMSVISNYSSNFFKFVPFFWASTVCRHSKSRGRLLCVKIRIPHESPTEQCCPPHRLRVSTSHGKPEKSRKVTIFGNRSRKVTEITDFCWEKEKLIKTVWTLIACEHFFAFCEMNQSYRDATWSLFSWPITKSHFFPQKVTRSHSFQKIRPKIIENPDKREKKHKKYNFVLLIDGNNINMCGRAARSKTADSKKTFAFWV